ncbi:MAG TPA: cation transporter [Naasia sp.]|jgi:copper chaperone CopZ
MTADRIQLPLAAATSCSCCATAPAGSDQRTAAADADSSTLLVQGMTCAHCVASVTEELGELDGVDSVVVDLVAGGTSAVTVTTSGPVSPEALRAAVKDAGYEVVSQ